MAELSQQVETNKRSDRVTFILTPDQAETLIRIERICIMAHSASYALQEHDLETVHDRLRTIACLCGSSLDEYQGIKGK